MARSHALVLAAIVACSQATPTASTVDAGSLSTPCAQMWCEQAGVCADLQTNASHCGACGASCATGQTCVVGVCQCDARACSPGVCGPDATCHGSTRVSESDSVQSVAVGNLVVVATYYYAGGSVMVLNGGQGENLSSYFATSAPSVAAYGDDVFYVELGKPASGPAKPVAVMAARCLAGTRCVVRQLAQGSGAALTATATHLYWIDATAHVVRCASSGCAGAPETVTSVPGTPQGGALMQIDTTHIAIAQDNALYLGPLALGSTMSFVVRESYIAAVATNAQYLFWTNATAIMRCKKDDCAATRAVFAMTEATPSGLVVDESSAYWVAQPNGKRPTMFYAPITGASASALFTFEKPSLMYGSAPCLLIGDASHLYYGCGVIYAYAK